MAKTKLVWASTYRTSEVKDGEIVRTVNRPGEDVSGLDSDTKKDYEERGLIVSRDDFESDDEPTVSKTQEAGTAKAQASSGNDGDE